MTQATIETLQQQFALGDVLSIIEGKGGFAVIDVQHPEASAQISIYAGQVLSYQPKGAEDLLFLSDKAYYQPGKAIKGGVPVCWPWFGPHPSESDKPAHGFVRNRQWGLKSTEMLESGAVKVVLQLEDDDSTRALWPYAFELLLEITIGAQLQMALVTRNTGVEDFSITQALHTYFSIGDISKTTVTGLEGCTYLDKADQGQAVTQSGPVTISAEVDRIYTGVGAELTIVDEAQARKIQIESAGNSTAVVWNPWEKIAAAMADLEDADYHRFICVETTNAADDKVFVAAGSESRLSVVYSV